MIWGYALIWPGQFLAADPDPLLARLKFLAHYGLHSTGVGLGQLAICDDAKLARVGQLVNQHDLALTLIAHLPYFEPNLDVVRSAVDVALEQIARFREIVHCPLVHTGVGDGYHRFLRQPSLEWQIERLATVLPWLVDGCRKLGLPFGIENHGDYYLSDLVGLCQRVPGLGIFLDTGNCFLVGETPLPAFTLAAPYVVGGHFKDHHVQPCLDASPLHFEIGNAVIGEGDVPLRECYALLKERCPNFAQLVMQIELIPPNDRDMTESFEKSLAFVRSLA